VNTAIRVCGRCGATVSGDATREVCPACLLETGLGVLDGESVAGAGSSAAVSAKADDPGRDGAEDFDGARIMVDETLLPGGPEAEFANLQCFNANCLNATGKWVARCGLILVSLQ
jgi:hypothetical protein